MSVVGTFAFLIVLLAVGRFLAWRGVPDTGADVLNRVGIGVFFPAAILLHAPDLEMTSAIAALVGVPWFIIAVVAVVAVVAVRVFGVDKQLAAVVGLGCCFGNTAFIGYAVVPAFVGDAGVPFAVVFDQLGSFFAVSTVGVVVVALVAGRRPPTVWEIGKKVITFPPLVALLVGVTIMPRDPGPDVDKALAMLAGALLPTMAIAVGLRFRLRVAPGDRWPLFIVCVGKLIIVPALALVCVRVLGGGGAADLVGDVIVIQAAMPVMITVGALLAWNDIRKELAASMVAISLLLSMVTLPLWHLVEIH